MHPNKAKQRLPPSMNFEMIKIVAFDETIFKILQNLHFKSKLIKFI